MISLVKVIIEHFSKLLGKRGELRNKDILLTPQLSSSVRMLKFLSSCVLLKMSLRGEHLCSTWQSQQNETISRDAHVSPMGFLSMTKDKIIGRCLEFFTKQKIGMTLVSLFFSLFLLFPNSSYSAVYFLPDAQWDNPINVSIDSSQCEDAGYTYYSSGQCPAYHNQDTCVFSDRYLKCDAEGWCRDNAYTITSCSSPKVVNTQCPNGLSLYKYCVCPSEYKYSCTGTGYSGGSGTACDGKYTKCNCSTYYSWNGSACAHVHSYVCPSGYKETSSGMIEPASTSKVCQLSGCSSTSGSCYKETHSHSYSCSSGYSSSCSYGYSGTSPKSCWCGATSGSCYSCKSYCEANPCGSGCYTNLSCTYGCNSYNSCGGCNSCASNPCAGVSCPSAVSCTYGCASYSSSTSCCSSVCTSCKGQCEANPCAAGCYTDKSCTYGCASTNSCGGCESCKGDPCASTTCPTAVSCPNGCASYSTATSCCSSVCTSCKTDPCASVTCPTAKSCDYGCASTSSATSCCSSVCTSCKTKCEANPCASGCYTNLQCSAGCKTPHPCGGCAECQPDCSKIFYDGSLACGGCPGYGNADCCRSVDAAYQQCLSNNLT